MWNKTQDMVLNKKGKISKYRKRAAFLSSSIPRNLPANQCYIKSQYLLLECRPSVPRSPNFLREAWNLDFVWNFLILKVDKQFRFSQTWSGWWKPICEWAGVHGLSLGTSLLLLMVVLPHRVMQLFWGTCWGDECPSWGALEPGTELRAPGDRGTKVPLVLLGLYQSHQVCL